MPRASSKQTTAKNLLGRFDTGDEVLDYFDLDAGSTVFPSAPTDLRLDVQRLQRAVRIAEQIAHLETQLEQELDGLRKPAEIYQRC